MEKHEREEIVQERRKPPLDHLENFLIWVDLIKVIPLGLTQYVPWAPSMPPALTNPGYSHYFPSTKATVQLIVHICTFAVCTVYRTHILCILHYACIRISIFVQCRGYLSGYSLSDCLAIDYFQLSSSLYVILILQMYLSYFDHVTR